VQIGGKCSASPTCWPRFVKNIEENGEPEPPDVFAPTLFRLQLLLPN
jgi:hypothetical protein